MFCFCFQVVAKFSIMAWYQANKTYVAAVLCENKAKPELNCCGKCYLNKQLKKADEPAPADGKHQVKFEKTELIAVLSDAVYLPFSASSSPIQHGGHYRSPAGRLAPCSIFHPPPTVVVA
jgi:hypothetical protein